MGGRGGASGLKPQNTSAIGGEKLGFWQAKTTRMGRKVNNKRIRTYERAVEILLF